jgi:hypothetical protein
LRSAVRNASSPRPRARDALQIGITGMEDCNANGQQKEGTARTYLDDDDATLAARRMGALGLQ